MRKYVYTLKSDLLEKVIDNYIDYVSNPLNKMSGERYGEKVKTSIYS